ncbi:unnamed protein product [Amoebophrya sp. A120]|nr:unnamed protein product [Amoebophrya sp. A120]|eukprot:GSA120T00020987001.1
MATVQPVEDLLLLEQAEVDMPLQRSSVELSIDEMLLSIEGRASTGGNKTKSQKKREKRKGKLVQASTAVEAAATGAAVSTTPQVFAGADIPGPGCSPMKSTKTRRSSQLLTTLVENSCCAPGGGASLANHGSSCVASSSAPGVTVTSKTAMAHPAVARRTVTEEDLSALLLHQKTSSPCKGMKSRAPGAPARTPCNRIAAQQHLKQQDNQHQNGGKYFSSELFEDLQDGNYSEESLTRSSTAAGGVNHVADACTTVQEQLRNVSQLSLLELAEIPRKSLLDKDCDALLQQSNDPTLVDDLRASEYGEGAATCVVFRKISTQDDILEQILASELERHSQCQSHAPLSGDSPSTPSTRVPDISPAVLTGAHDQSMSSDVPCLSLSPTLSAGASAITPTATATPATSSSTRNDHPEEVKRIKLLPGDVEGGSSLAALPAILHTKTAVDDATTVEADTSSAPVEEEIAEKLTSKQPSVKAKKEDLTFHVDLRPNNRETLSELELGLVEQTKQLFNSEFEEDFATQCSKKGGYRLTIMTEKDTNEVCSFVMYKINPKEKCLSIAHVAVPASKRRRGFGKIMMQWVIKYAKKQPRSNVAFLALSSMPGSIKFHQSLGFKKDKKMMNKSKDSSTSTSPLSPRGGGGGVENLQMNNPANEDEIQYAEGQVYMTYPIKGGR